uniref:Fibronectin type-III domain-containing protein n=1 Tax=Romanomermis culicivorax TaxID=13658 RepID=A0A915JQV3_ROMCU
FKGLYHVVTNDTYLIIDEPSDQHLSINITILNDYQSFKVQQFTLLVEEVAHYANLTAFPITPNCIGLLWTAYKTSDTKSIIYSTNITDNDSTVISLKDSSSAKCQDTVCSKLVCHTFIKPGTKYHCKIVGKTQQGVRKFETTTVGLTMKSLPGSLVVVDRTVDSLILNWTFFKNLEAKPRNIGFFYKKISDQKWRNLLNPEYQPLLESYSTTIKNLTSDSQYSIKYSTNYLSENVYNERFFQFDQIFEWTITAATLPDIYITPKMTNVEIVQKLDGNFTLQWKLSDPKVSVTQFIVMY